MRKFFDCSKSARSKFDFQFYENKYGLKLIDEVEALEHYLNRGDRVNYSPISGFDTLWVRHTNKHFDYDETTALELFTASKQRTPYPSSDAEKEVLHALKFLIQNGDWVDVALISQIAARSMSLPEAASYFLHNLESIPSPNLWFSANEYLARYPDVWLAGVNPAFHYISHGMHEERELPCSLKRGVGGYLPSGFFSRHYARFSERESSRNFAGHILLEGAEKSSLCRSTSEVHNGALVVRHQNAFVVGGTRALLFDIGSDFLAIHDRESALIIRGENCSPKVSPLTLVGDEKATLNISNISSVKIPRAVSLMNEYDNNYFHFVIECLSLTYFFDAGAISQDTVVLVSAGMPSNHYAFLDLILGDSNFEIFYVERGEAIQVTELIEISSETQILDYYDSRPNDSRIRIHRDSLKYIVNKIKEKILADDQAPVIRNIYLQRSSKVRRVVNEAEILDNLMRTEFEVCDTGSLSAKAQVRLISQCKTLIAPTGASLTNILFMPAGSTVIVLQSDHPATNTAFWDILAQISGVALYRVVGARCFSVTGTYGVHDDFHVPWPALMGQLDDAAT